MTYPNPGLASAHMLYLGDSILSLVVAPIELAAMAELVRDSLRHGEVMWGY